MGDRTMRTPVGNSKTLEGKETEEGAPVQALAEAFADLYRPVFEKSRELAV